jgi:heme/copper-type cytochrome/quinol oxidase subunit 2
MPIVIEALPKDEYEKWLKEAKVKFANKIDNNINKLAFLEKKVVKEIK